MDKTNLPRGVLSRLEKLCPSLFINSIFLTWGLSLEVTKDVSLGQVCLEILHLIAMDDIIFFLMYGDVSNSKFVCKIK